MDGSDNNYNFYSFVRTTKTNSMSEETKNLGDEAKESLNEAKEAASEFAEDAKEATKEFVEDAKEALSDGKTIAIVAHLTIIGFIIAIVMNSSNRTEFGSFYIRQTLGIFLLGLVTFIPLIGWIAGIGVFILWLVSLIGALGGNKKPVFLLGEQFQEWFKSI